MTDTIKALIEARSEIEKGITPTKMQHDKVMTASYLAMPAITAMYEENKRLREALWFYADLNNYEGISLGVCPLNEDRGQKARSILERGEG